MKWVMFPAGDRAHAVLDSDLTQTLEGMEIPPGTIFHDGAPPFGIPRCGNCDKAWRRKGRENKPPRVAKPGYKPGTVYRPRFTLKDWENER